jgi:hypothetical protein
MGVIVPERCRKAVIGVSRSAQHRDLCDVWGMSDGYETSIGGLPW